MSALISKYKSELEKDNDLGLSFEFENISPESKTLCELLGDDFDYLIKFNPELEYLKSKVFFAQCDEKINAVSVITSENDEYLIVFNKNIIELIHHFFGLTHLAFQKSIYIEEFVNIGNNEIFTDENMFYILLKKISYMYDKRFDDAELIVDFCFEPFDYVEKVIAARRFILAHELSHIYCKHHEKSINDKKFDYHYYSRIHEYEADSNGIYFLMNRFFKQMPFPIEFSEYCCLENHLSGIPQLFLLFDLVEGFYDWFEYKPQHPRAFMREIGSIETLYERIVDSLGDNTLLKYYLQIVTIENQIIKRLPMNLIYDSVKDYVGFVQNKTYKLRYLSGLKLTGKAKELESFLTEYEPYNINRYKNLDKFEIELLCEHYLNVFGFEQGSIMIENLSLGKTEGINYDTYEWEYLINLRRRYINSAKKIKENEKNQY